MTPDQCIVCGNGNFNIRLEYHSPDIYEMAVGVSAKNYSRQWVQCEGCQFHYSRYSRNPRVLEKIYECDYRKNDQEWRQSSTEEIFDRVVALPANESETIERINWIKVAIADCEKSDLISWRADGLRMLDVGGATGVFAYLFQDEIWEAHIIDPAEDGRVIQEKHHIPYHWRSYEPGVFDLKFDLVSLIFVLEHLRDPMAMLAGVQKDLVHGGVLYVEIPDAVAFENLPSEDDIFNSCHLWMFDPNSILLILKQCGFEVLRLNRGRTIRGHFSLNILAKALA